jgi:hypothetical protein
MPDGRRRVDNMLLSRMPCPAASALDTKCSHVRNKIGSETFNSHCHISFKLEPQSMSSKVLLNSIL